MRSLIVLTKHQTLPGRGKDKDAKEDLTAPSELEVRLVSDQFLSLIWDAPERPAGGAGVVGYHVFYKEHGSDR
jgi:hypothetical protein